MLVEHFPVGPLGCTCTLIADLESREALLIDPGAEAPRILAYVTKLGLRVRHLLHTHAHIDHVGATEELRRCCNARTAIHGDDLPLTKTLGRQAAFLGLEPVEQPTFDDLLVDADEIPIGKGKVKALHTPGHTHGSMSFVIEDKAQHTIMSGDTLFAEGIGRWDIGGSSQADIVASIRQKLLPYPDDTIVIPGHGRATTIGHERHSNPYLRQI